MLGAPKGNDHVGVWGKSPTAPRGEAVAERRDAAILRVEDAFLRSVRTGRDGDPPLGLVLDKTGIHFDSSAPSDLEHILANDALDDTALLDQARRCMERLRVENISKYNSFNLELEPPEPGYVLVIDQTHGDASVVHGGGSEGLFREMLAFAQIEHPGARILIKTHPETHAGHRAGYFDAQNEDDRTKLFTAPVSPWALLEGAIAVYTVSSGLGFEAIVAGHKPRVFGQPFYGGWGLTQDENPVPRRTRTLTRAQLFAAAMILYPTWYDPYADELCSLDHVINTLAAQTRAWREDQKGHVAYGMRLWKRKPLQSFFGQQTPVQFANTAEAAAEKAQANGQSVIAWAGKVTEALEEATARVKVPLIRVEDGFLRSRGLGADLIPPVSLVSDDLGIYYDPRSPSRLERLIASSENLPSWKRARAETLIAALRRSGVSKYNLADLDRPDIPDGRRILVPGQVEDDASIQTGCDTIGTNQALLETARTANPDAIIVYKPHPDVEAGLRSGNIEDAGALADVIANQSDPIALIQACDEVWTMTSLLGFEALVRDTPVTCLGTPFYAGWGLTQDKGTVPHRRQARPDIIALVHATLIDYPRYFDPFTGLPCPVEVALNRLQTGSLPKPGFGNRALAKMQGLLAGYAHLWR